MDISKNKPENIPRPDGQDLGSDSQDLVQVLAVLTGLPAAGIENELQQVLPSSSGQSLNQMNLDQLRETLAAYLDLVQAEFLEDLAIQQDE